MGAARAVPLRPPSSSAIASAARPLRAAGLSDPELAERWRITQSGWRGLIAVRLEELERDGGELPMRPLALTTLIANLFEGAETEILAGVTEEESPHLEALEACAELIARAERAR